MNKIIILSLGIIAIISSKVIAQSNKMDKGFNDLVLGITHSQLDEAIGFNGNELSPDNYFNQVSNERNKEDLPEYKKGFDLCIEYKFLMPIPVTKVFLKSDKVVIIEVSSYPDFTRPICLDSQTPKGLKFWDNRETMEKIYGKNYRTVKTSDGNTTYYYYDAIGLGFGVANNEIRIIDFY